MRITDNPLALPASCLFCPGSVRSWYIDCDFSIEFHGALYICEHCFGEMARLAGASSQEDTERFTKRINELEQELYAANLRASQLEKAVDGLTGAGYRSSGADLSSMPVNVSAPEVAKPKTSGIAKGASKGTEDVGTGTGETPESKHDEGVAELHSDEPVQPRPGEFAIFE